MAIALSIRFKVKSALPSLAVLADSTDQADRYAVQNFVAKRFLGNPAKALAWGFVPTMGDLAVFAYQEISGKDLGFTNWQDSREKMPEIIRKLRADPRWKVRIIHGRL